MSTNSFNGQKRADVAERLREIRDDLCGEYGSQFLADALEIPLQTWLNYEFGIVVPDYVVLQLLVLACVDPRGLLTGEGEEYDQDTGKTQDAI